MPGGKDEEDALRKKALESMAKKRRTGDGSETSGGGDEGSQRGTAAVEEGELVDEGRGVRRENQAGKAKAGRDAEMGVQEAGPEPATAPSKHAASAPPPAARESKKKSKWAEDDSDDEEPAKPAHPPAVPAALPKSTATTPPVKSKWADATPSPPHASADGSGKDGGGGKQDVELLSKASAASSSVAALDMLEDRMRRGGGGGSEGVNASVGVSEGGAEEGAGDAAGGGSASVEAEVGGGSAALSSEKLSLHRCREVDKAYQKLNHIDEGTYGVVFRAKCRVSDKVVALKQVKLGDTRQREGFPLTALRELTVLLGLRHKNIVDVHEVVVSPKKQVFMVMEYMEHDFRSLMENMHRPFRTSEVKCLMLQLLAGTEFMHRHWVIHRDLKTSNLLMDNKGNLKLCDFGLARLYCDPVANMTPEVVTLWYRAPELLYGEKTYGTAIDMWSVGCIFGELILKEPILKGRNEQEMRDKIVELMGTPDEENWPKFKELPGAKNVRYKKRTCQLRDKFPKVSYTGGASLSEAGYEMLLGLLRYDPDDRMTAREALGFDSWFQEEPKSLKPEDMPTWPSQHEKPKDHKKRARSPTEMADFDDDDKRFNRLAV